MSIGKESENNGTNSGILGQMENLQGQSNGQDNVRQRGSNSENLRKYMEKNGIFVEKEQELSANGDGWSNERLPYKLSVDNFRKHIESIRGEIQGRRV